MKRLAMLFVLIFSLPSLAAINPIYRCSERGYQIIDGKCVSDNTSCPIEDFASGKCQFGNECVPEGKHVWSPADRCCDGLSPYLPAGVSGQPTCESVSSTLFNPISIFVLAAVIGYLLVGRRKTKKRK